MGKVYHANINAKIARMVNSISDEAYFRGMRVPRDKDGHYAMIKGSIHQADITSLSVHATNSFKIHKAKTECWKEKWKNTQL